MNLLSALAGNLDRPDPQRLEGEVEDPDAFLVARNERRVHELDVEHVAIVGNRNRSQFRNERDLFDLGRLLRAGGRRRRWAAPPRLVVWLDLGEAGSANTVASSAGIIQQLKRVDGPETRT